MIVTTGILCAVELSPCQAAVIEAFLADIRQR